jgi:hypothetical protein
MQHEDQHRYDDEPATDAEQAGDKSGKQAEAEIREKIDINND